MPLPNEIFSDLANFLPNDDMTDLMLLSRTFHAIIHPRLHKIDEEMSTKDQHIESFMPSPAPDTDREWISQLDLQRFEPIGSVAKNRMKEAFGNRDDFLRSLWNATNGIDSFVRLKQRLSLERFDDATFLRILGAMVAMPKFRQEYKISYPFAQTILPYTKRNRGDDVLRIWMFYQRNG
ncbi:hypothetical protein DdX_14650 [Ditylenchus destructor]|uniref:F-box domain-containing protein n=1 Tax=Ditylenchus destructor TaxID=166010 RepID=A0AAD4MQS0_9BILA|nr:hypothetical protein DdX_14650 [Ditylenchus destructor]